jgi:methylated-DNA-[protein]-cysteine S-methyltransferase
MTASTPTVCTTVDSPIGPLLLAGDDEGAALSHLYQLAAPRPFERPDAWVEKREPFAQLVAQLDEYFAGERQAFDVELALTGSPFQLEVWGALRDIPYGETISYGELAQRIDRPNASRAVGLANGANPVSIIVPCHRVIGADGSLTGYGGGLDHKRALLGLESGQRELLPSV